MRDAIIDSELAADLRQANASRAEFDRFLASLYLYELTADQVEALAGVTVEDDGSDVARGLGIIREYLRHRDRATPQALAVDYAHVFLGAGTYDKIMAPPYESVFTSEERILMQDARDGALAYYRAEGLELPADNTTPEDHLGFELQFAALLAERMAEALEAGEAARAAELADLQRSFFTYHQANWLPALCDAVEEHAQTAFYRGVALVTRGYLAAEEAFVAEQTQALGLGEAVDEVLPPWRAAEADTAEADA